MENFDRQLVLNGLKTRLGNFENSAESEALIKCFEFCESVEITQPKTPPEWVFFEIPKLVVATRITGITQHNGKVYVSLNSGEVLTMEYGDSLRAVNAAWLIAATYSSESD